MALVALSPLVLVPSKAAAKVVEVGQPPLNLQPSCEPKPGNCTAIGKVTGFQDTMGGTRNPYVVPQDGRLVSWGLALGTPGNWVDFFNGVFGAGPKARVVVLRKAQGDNRYKLIGESETVDLEPYYGTAPSFALDGPIQVKAQDVVALTLPTWAPLFRVNLAQDFSWRADRSSKSCSKVRKGVVHSRGTRPYDCVFRTAQLLYYAEIDTGAAPPG